MTADLIKEHRFLMSSKSWCPDCKYAKAIFDKYKVLDKVYTIELDKIDPREADVLEKQFTAISGRKWVPTIFFDGKVFGTEQTLKQLESRDSTEKAFKDAGLL
ncbi:DEKNAAC100896 [Brettanomyces naardenensis]|uniref:DEKNAAC100897 n=1 Tax=Brettanomyces naardenensis TaxID=13370 RepID=A0A448YEQ4_BRENA|nr:DEKNAAC100896 [Brettanomyces naardenensis]